LLLQYLGQLSLEFLNPSVEVVPIVGGRNLGRHDDAQSAEALRLVYEPLLEAGSQHKRRASGKTLRVRGNSLQNSGIYMASHYQPVWRAGGESQTADFAGYSNFFGKRPAMSGVAARTDQS
jgi:hypothetical protein